MTDAVLPAGNSTRQQLPLHVVLESNTEQPVRIGLISDTHGVLCQEVLERLRGVRAILHAGDVGHHGGHKEVLARLRAVAPTYAVRGNVDDVPDSDTGSDADGDGAEGESTPVVVTIDHHNGPAVEGDGSGGVGAAAEEALRGAASTAAVAAAAAAATAATTPAAPAAATAATAAVPAGAAEAAVTGAAVAGSPVGPQSAAAAADWTGGSAVPEESKRSAPYSLPQHVLCEVGGWRILVTHVVGWPPHAVTPEAAALLQLCSPVHIVVFGHSHNALDLRHGVVRYCNPGSAGPARFRLPRTAALLELPPGGPASGGEPAFTLIPLAPKAPPRLLSAAAAAGGEAVGAHGAGGRPAGRKVAAVEDGGSSGGGRKRLKKGLGTRA